MICSNCGSVVDGTKKYCHVCGYPVQQPAEADVDATAMAAPSDGMDYAAPDVNNSEFTEGGYAVSSAPAYAQPATTSGPSYYAGFEEKPKKNNIPKILIPIVAVLLVVIIAFGGWGIFLAVNPQVKVAKAVEKTLFKTKSFSFELSADGYDVAEGYVAFGKTTFTSDFFVEIEDMGLVCDDGQLLVPYSGNEYIAIDLPEVFAGLTENLDDVLSDFVGGDAEEVSEMLEDEFGVEVTPEKVTEWAETIIKNKTINEKVIEEIWNTVAIPVAAKYLDLDEKDIPDYDDIRSIIAGALTKGINGDAFKVEDTSKKDGVKYYECEVDLYELAKGMLEYALDCKKLEGILEAEQGGETLREFLEDTLDDIDEDYFPDDPVEFTVGIKNGYLVAVEFDDLEVKISEINKNHDAKEDYAEVEDDADSVIEFDFDTLKDEFLGGKKEEIVDDYYGYYDEYYY